MTTPMIYISDSGERLERIAETVKNIRYLDGIDRAGKARFDYSGHLAPFSIVPLAMIGYNRSLHFENTPSYCRRIHFPAGQKIAEHMGNERSYSPLIRADLMGLSDLEKEKKLRELSDKYVFLLRRHIITDEVFTRRMGGNAPHLLATEMIDNIYEHANARHVFILSQYDRATSTCEICLADDGDGIFNSLLGAGRDVRNDVDALQKVILHMLSSKDEFGSVWRGTGIRNTINILSSKELNGFFCVISGPAGYFTDGKNHNRFMDFQDFRWPGTIINMGFHKPQQAIDIYEYIS
jgi:hypothetical protein